MNKLLKNLLITSKEKNIGFALFRVFVGAAFIIHGYPKMEGGLERWRAIGGAMGKLGIKFLPGFWGFMAATSEFFGGIFLILGLFTTVSSFLIFFTMLIAAFFVHQGDPFMKRELALVYFFASFLFMIKGAGKYSIDALITKSPVKQ